MEYSDKLYTYYLELARAPCSQTSFAGTDVRFSSEYEALESELAKVQSLHGTGQPDWQKIIDISERLLREQSKDLRVAVWLTWALYQCESFCGLLAGLGLLRHLCDRHWPAVYPGKPRTRGAALGWLVLRFESLFSENFSLHEQQPLFRSMLEHLEPCHRRGPPAAKGDLGGLRANFLLTSQRNPGPFQMAAWRTFRLPEQL